MLEYEVGKDILDADITIFIYPNDGNMMEVNGICCIQLKYFFILWLGIIPHELFKRAKYYPHEKAIHLIKKTLENIVLKYRSE